jgi:hypothetical protein
MVRHTRATGIPNDKVRPRRGAADENVRVRDVGSERGETFTLVVRLCRKPRMYANWPVPDENAKPGFLLNAEVVGLTPKVDLVIG